MFHDDTVKAEVERATAELTADRDRLASRVQALEESIREVIKTAESCEAFWVKYTTMEGGKIDANAFMDEKESADRRSCDAFQSMKAALAAQPDRRQDMGSRADNYKNQEPPHIRGA